MVELAILNSNPSVAKHKMNRNILRNWRVLGSLAAMLAFVCAGCGSNLQPAGGQVSVDGTPVKEGTIMFYPVGGGRPATGVIADGKFTLSFEKPGDGLPPGDYKVVIVADVWKEGKGKTKAQEIEEAQAKKSGAIEQTSLATTGELTHIVPPIYNDIKTTPLKQTVATSGAAENYVFDISTKK